MKKVFLTIATLALTSLLFLVYYYNFSPNALKGRRNIQNLKLIKNGMDSTQVLRIMGPPSYIYPMYNGGPIIYSYISPPGNSNDHHVYFDKDHKVVIGRPN